MHVTLRRYVPGDFSLQALLNSNLNSNFICRVSDLSTYTIKAQLKKVPSPSRKMIGLYFVARRLPAQGGASNMPHTRGQVHTLYAVPCVCVFVCFCICICICVFCLCLGGCQHRELHNAEYCALFTKGSSHLIWPVLSIEVDIHREEVKGIESYLQCVEGATLNTATGDPLKGI